MDAGLSRNGCRVSTLSAFFSLPGAAKPLVIVIQMHYIQGQYQ
jgi:hypothetical protein